MSLAILISGGLDSSILAGDASRRGQRIFPLFVRCGLAWEETELCYLRRYLAALRCSEPLVLLEQPVADLYGTHWSVTGRNVPSATDPDEMVFLPGRNVLLLAKAILWCHLHKVPQIALGSLATNPFPDATSAFFKAMQDVVNMAVNGQVRVVLPFAGMKKPAVMKLGEGLPLEHTFSCIQPANGLHCGGCNKCAERQHAFESAGMADPTRYAKTPSGN